MSANRLITRLGLNTWQLQAVIASLLLMATSAYMVIKLVEERYQAYLHNELFTVLQGVTKSIHIWSREQRLQVQSLARNAHVLEITKELLSTPRERETLLAAPGQKELRHEMHSYLESGFYEGYFIIAPDNVSLASSRDANVGTSNLLVRYPKLLLDIWNGETRLTPIQRSDVPLKRGTEMAASGNETMFVATPIRDEKGSVIALLTLRINPYNTLFPILEQARIGETGDSYAFDPYGTLLSRSRYENELVRSGILEPGQSSASNLLLVDPGVDLTKTSGDRPAGKELPLTRMAASATQGETAIDLEGYRNFLGVPVIGAWKWDDELSFGFAVEQHRSEAYAVFHFMRLTTIGGGIITTLILFVLVVVFVAGKRKVANIQARLQAIVETASDGIVVIDHLGRIESVNPAMEEIFGHNAEQMIGSNVRMLMPEPHHSAHDYYLARYLETGEGKIIGIGREAEALRSNGEIFPIGLSINRLQLENGLHFAGVIQDISVRKQAEHDLEQERDFTRDVLDSLSAHIAVLDETGTIVLTNRAWKAFAEQNDLSADQVDVGINYLQTRRRISGASADENNEADDKLREMLAGQLDAFTVKYPCHSPNEQRWFEMRANRFMHHDRPIVVVSHTNITPQMEFEQRLKNANKQLRITSLVAETTDNAVIVTDLQGITQWVNRGFTRLNGYTLDEIVGRKPGALLQGPGTDKAVSHRIGDAVRAGKRIEGEILNYHKNGSPYWIHFEISPVYDERQNLVQFVALERNITKEKRLLEDLQLEKEATENANKLLSLTQQALDRTGIGEYWIAAKDGQVLRVNDHACSHLGYSREELLQLKVPDFDPNFTEEKYPQLIAPIVEQGWGRIETAHRTKEGVDIPVEVIIVYLPDAPSGEPMSIAFSIDISEHKKTEQAIIRAREEAEEANRAKSTFLATMSHEIRTPLYGVVGTVDMLAHTQLDSAQTDLVNTARDSAVLLQGIIDDILDFSKIEAGKLDLERTPLTLEPLVEKLGENLQHLANKRGVELLIYSDPELPELKGGSGSPAPDPLQPRRERRQIQQRPAGQKRPGFHRSIAGQPGGRPR